LPNLLFDPEYGGDKFLRNTGLSPKYVALQPVRSYSAYKTSIGKFEEETPFGRPRHKWKDNAQMDLTGTESEDME
jgi:hypothetical protein